MERVDLQVLEQDAAVPVDDRLRQPGRARRVEDEERVIERHRLEAQVALVRGQLVPGHRVVDAGRIGPEVGEDDGRGEARERRADGGHLGAAVHLALPVSVAVDREEHLRLDLAESVDDGSHAELGRAARPDRPQRSGGEQRDDGLGDVRQVAGDAVATADPEALEPGAHATDLGAQLVGGQGHPIPRLRARDDHRVRSEAAGQAQAVLGPVQVRGREPARAGHASRRPAPAPEWVSEETSK